MISGEGSRRSGPRPTTGASQAILALGGVAIWNLSRGVAVDRHSTAREAVVNGLIYLIGLIVVIMFILSFLGLH